mgnify:CR=1 FL=1
MRVATDGIAAAVLGSIVNYLLLGLAPQVDHFYLKSFEIFLACAVVFPGIGNVGYTLLEYRLGHRDFFDALFENLRWIPFLCVLLSLSVSRVCGTDVIGWTVRSSLVD